MNSWNIGIENLERIISTSNESDLTYPAKCGLYGAARTILDDIERHATSERGPDGYLSEKVGGVRWHIGAIYGFDVDNGHNAEAHRAWAYGDLQTLKSLLEDRCPEES